MIAKKVKFWDIFIDGFQGRVKDISK